jgi:hypothetical protein
MASTTQISSGTSKETLQEQEVLEEQQEEKTFETKPTPANSAVIPDVPQSTSDLENNEPAAGESPGRNMSTLKVIRIHPVSESLE